jgi:hypothetical protein
VADSLDAQDSPGLKHVRQQQRSVEDMSTAVMEELWCCDHLSTAVHSSFTQVEFGPGKPVFRKGEQGNDFYIVREVSPTDHGIHVQDCAQCH